MSEQLSRLTLNLLRDLDIAVLKRLDAGNYQFCGKAPAFYVRLFPNDDNGLACTAPWLYSPMLDFFITEAEEFFASARLSARQPINSGIWLEEIDGEEDLPLLATARYVEDEAVILVQCVREHYAERTRILRRARIELLERDRISDALDKFKHKSLHDALTGLYNRGAFEDMLNIQLAANRRSNRSPLTLLMLDIDHFKHINDTFGHLAGDAVLKQMGILLQDTLRKEDVAARYGGEEFVVLIPHTHLEQAAIVAEKLRCRVEKHDFGINHVVTISIGVCAYINGDNNNDFIDRCDKALYQAKNSGRNCGFIYDTNGQCKQIA